MLFEDTFICSSLNDGGKKFDRVDRIYAHSESYNIDIVCDIASHIYPINENDRFQLQLSSTLNLDGTPDSNQYIPYRDEATLLDRYDYVMCGKVFKLNYTTNNNIEILISYGGLLMSVKGEQRNLLKLDLDMRVYLLIKKI